LNSLDPTGLDDKDKDKITINWFNYLDKNTDWGKFSVGSGIYLTPAEHYDKLPKIRRL
jgi:hypothetical protein